MSRRVAWFLLGFGIWSWIIWITFVKNLWASNQSWNPDGSATPFFVVHVILAIVSFALGTVIGVLGWRALRSARRPAEAEAKVG